MAEARSTLQEQLAELQRWGAWRYDPVRFRYLESLTGRLAGSRHRIHQDKLQHALDQFRDAFLAGKANAEALSDQLIEQDNASQEDLQRYLDNGDFKAIHHLAARHRQAPSPLKQLLLTLQDDDGENDRPPDHDDTLSTLLREQHSRLQRLGGKQPAAPRRELKTTRHLRATQARLHNEHRIHQAITDTPDDAGPLNAHRLVTRAVERMREISPAYLNRFAGYMEMLTGLEKAARKT